MITIADSRFPHLSNCEQTSAPTAAYNCIAWAAGETHRCWWPRPERAWYWPPAIPREETIIRFVEAFALLGYGPCHDGGLEAGWQKVVLYACSGTPRHMARQLENGVWTSKLGSSIDIAHVTVEELEGPAYGSVEQYLRRTTQLSS